MVKVLIVDDEEKTRGLIKLLINKEIGIHSMYEATNGEEGMEVIKKESPSIVITDIRMPIVDGLELAQRALAYKPDLLIIMMSAYEEFKYAQRAIKLGVYDYLLKPVRKNELNEALEKAIAKINGKQDKPIVSEKDNTSHSIIQQVIDYVTQHMGDEKLSLSTVADHFFLNSSYLSRLFKKEVGEPFIEYLTKLRIEKAVWYLENTDKKAYEIAELVGVVDATYFSKCFKKNKGMCINDYKKVIKK